MKTVGSFLERFKKLKAPERSVYKAVICAVKEVVGVELESGCIKISGGTIYINTHSVVRSNIFENKRVILSRINSILKNEQIADIK